MPKGNEPKRKLLASINWFSYKTIAEMRSFTIATLSWFFSKAKENGGAGPSINDIGMEFLFYLKEKDNVIDDKL